MEGRGGVVARTRRVGGDDTVEGNLGADEEDEERHGGPSDLFRGNDV